MIMSLRQWWGNIRQRRRVKLTATETTILQRLWRGDTLKSHRDVDGVKRYQLHPLEGPGTDVPGAAVLALRRKRLLETNHKFPAATFLLTERGRAIAQTLDPDAPAQPLTARNFVERDG